MDKDASEVTMAGGAVSSSEVPYFHLIPLESLRRLALRFFVGTERKKDKAWNAITPNQQVLTDRPGLHSSPNFSRGLSLFETP